MILNRLAAVLQVLAFLFTDTAYSPFYLFWRQHHDDPPPFHRGFSLDYPHQLQSLDQIVEDVESPAQVDLFSSPEFHYHLSLVSMLQKPSEMVDLHLQVSFGNVGVGDLDLFHFAPLLLPSIFEFLVLLVFVLTEIHQTADRGV